MQISSINTLYKPNFKARFLNKEPQKPLQKTTATYYSIENAYIPNFYTHTTLSEAQIKEAKNYNAESSRQVLKPNVHYIKMAFYGERETWANSMSNLVYYTSMLMDKDTDFFTILSAIEKEINCINRNSNTGYGKLRTTQEHFFNINPAGRGREYFSRYLKKSRNRLVYKPKSNEEYKNANTLSIIAANNSGELYDNLCLHYSKPGGKNIELAKKEYEKFKNIKNPSIDDINRTVATIRWLIAQENPYKRGNDSIASVFTKAIYHNNYVEISPLKEGISLDFEAFDTDLDEYIEKYPTFFEKEPAFYGNSCIH